MWSKIKLILLLGLLVVIGLFAYYKIQASGDLNSSFNRHARFVLGKTGFWRGVLGLRNAGDARADYLENPGPIIVEFFKPVSQDLDDSVLRNFASAVEKYTGRKAEVFLAGGLSDSVVPLTNLNSFLLKGQIQKPANGSILQVYFTKDYAPRKEGELSTTFREDSIVISFDAHNKFLEGYSQYLNQYLETSLLHEFGHQIGLGHFNDRDCLMNIHAGINNKPQEFYGDSAPTDFCQKEKDKIESLKFEFK